MLTLYDHIEAIIQENNQRQRFLETQLNLFANDVMKILNIEDHSEITLSISRAFQACDRLKISFDKNFKRVFRFNGEELISDWKISPLASYLIIINCNPNNASVAKAQLYFAMKQANHNR
jgi:hypothetical protein